MPAVGVQIGTLVRLASQPGGGFHFGMGTGRVVIAKAHKLFGAVAHRDAGLAMQRGVQLGLHQCTGLLLGGCQGLKAFVQFVQGMLNRIGRLGPIGDHHVQLRLVGQQGQGMPGTKRRHIGQSVVVGVSGPGGGTRPCTDQPGQSQPKQFF